MSDPASTQQSIAQAPWKWRESLRRSKLPASGFQVGLALIDEFMNKKTGKVFPSFEAISIACDIPVRTVRAGVEALRRAGLVSTKKTKFDGSLNFLLSFPETVRSDGNQSLRDRDEVTEISHTKRHKTVTRSDINQSHEVTVLCHLTLEDNLVIEPENGTLETVARGPTDDGLRPSPLRYDTPSLRSGTSVSVYNDTSDGDCNASQTEEDADDVPFICPQLYTEQAAIIAEITGRKNAKAAAKLLQVLREGKLTPRLVALILKAEDEEAAS